MVITRLILDGYRRLMLRQIKHFDYTPTDIHQLILGTNGCGKTSVMRELSPLPAYGGDYVKGGYKAFHCTHRGSTYVLTSTFSTNAGKHSFIKDGVELNLGSTATVQRELVGTWLGLDTELMDVLLDTARFTAMPALKRREWVMRLSGADMTYAMRVYQSLRVQLRDAQGVVKHLNQRCSDALHRLPSESDIASYKVKVDVLQSALTTLMEAREPNLPAQSVINTRIQQIMSDMITPTQTIMQSRWLANGDSSIETLANHVLDIKHQQHGAQQRLDIAHEEIVSIQDIVNALESTHCAGVAELDALIDADARSMVQLNLPQLYAELDNPIRLLAQTDAIMQDAVDILSTIPVSDGRFTIAVRDQHLTDLDAKTALCTKATAVMGKLQHRIDHIQTADHTSCPKCGHVWQPGVTASELAELVARHATVHHEVTRLNAEIDIHRSELTLTSEYLQYVRRWTRVISNHPDLQPLWDMVAVLWYDDAPRAIIPMLTEWRHWLAIGVQYQSLRANQQKLIDARRHAETVGVDGASHYLQRMSTLTDIVTQSTQLQLELKAQLEVAESRRQMAIQLIRCSESIQSGLSELDTLLETLAKLARMDVLNDLIRQRQSELATATTVLNTAITAAAVMADITEQRDAALVRVESLTAMINELSPVDGLIADQLTEFVGCFAEQLTTVINSVWTYPLEVLPCGHDSGELDYKFPISVNSGALGAPDVGLGSKSQVAAVDFAFKLVVMMYLGLQDYPLYLDEVAVALDEQHRFNIVNFIKTYVETRQCSQMFMISHYDAQSGAFHPAETCILDSANIVHIPTVYNQHVVMH